MAVKTGSQLRAAFMGQDPNDWAGDLAQSVLLTNVKILTFAGRSGAGAITLTGAAVGDRVIAVAGLSTGALGNAGASFESAITVADQIQQSSASNLSSNNYLAILAPAVA